LETTVKNFDLEFCNCFRGTRRLRGTRIRCLCCYL